MNRNCLWLVAGLVLAAGFWAFGQTTQPTGPSRSPSQQDERAESAEQLLQRMLQRGGTGTRPLQPLGEAAAADRSTGDGSVAPGAPTLTVMREGTYITDRIGRLSRSDEGSLMEFRFESDGEALRDPPVIILPSLELMRMENMLTVSGRDLRFRISGMVTEYRGRNYVLVEKAVVVSEATQPF